MDARNSIQALIPTPNRREVDHVDLAAPPVRVWGAVRHDDLGRTRSLRLLLRLFRLGRRPQRDNVEVGVCVDDVPSASERAGFQLLTEEPPRRFTVGALARVRRATLEFAPVSSAASFAEWRDPGWVKIGFTVEVVPVGAACSRVRFEVRIGATDARSWRRFRRIYFVLGPLVRFVRRRVLTVLADQFGAAELVTHPARARMSTPTRR